MTKKERKRILILVIIVAVIIVAMVVSMNKKGKQMAENSGETNEKPAVSNEEYVQTLDDGTRLNTSTKLQETKKIEGLEISANQVTAKDNATELLGTIKNTSSTKKGNFLADIKVVDKDKKEIVKAQVLIPELEAGESTKLIISTNFDYANAYDFSISKGK